MRENIDRLNLNSEAWKFIESDDIVVVNFGNSKNTDLQMRNIDPDIPKLMFQHFGNKTFLEFQAQGFDQSVLVSAHKKEEDTFFKPVKLVPKNDVPRNANTVSSHVIYKLVTQMMVISS